MRKSFTTNKNVLTAYDGIKYKSYPFINNLHSELAFILKDLDQAKIIIKSYQEHILPLVAFLDDNEVYAFEKALLDVCL
ncbi:MAG: hypothetical protein FJZ57_08590, partial [Chlamydiae bacterium]|nr:hypothetical protein [Chlamydiota bacterium]